MSNRVAWTAIVAAAAAALVIGLVIGAVVIAQNPGPSTPGIGLTPTTVGAADAASTSTTVGPVPTASSDTDTATPIEDEGAPTYGTDDERQALLDVADGLDVTGVFADLERLLAAADTVCYQLELLNAQGRSPAFATTVVWNASLAELESEDLAGFGTVFSLAPTYLCPEHRVYAIAVAYILGI